MDRLWVVVGNNPFYLEHNDYKFKHIYWGIFLYG